jgi:hypothetical protein
MRESLKTGNERCPKCAKLGKDRRGDNLVRYDDGHAFCFACGYYVPPKSVSLTKLRRRLTQSQKDGQVFSTPEDVFGDITYSYPDNVQAWLNKYEITELETVRNNIQWAPKRELLILPIMSQIGSILATSARYFGQNPDHPKYINDYFGTREECIKAALRIPERMQVPALVLVEDMLSAIKVSRVSACTPLLGTWIPEATFAYLVAVASQHNWVVIPWLDPDKHLLSLQHSRKFRQFVPSYPVISLEDPKVYNTQQIYELVSIATQVATGASRELGEVQ